MGRHEVNAPLWPWLLVLPSITPKVMNIGERVVHVPSILIDCHKRIRARHTWWSDETHQYPGPNANSWNANKNAPQKRNSWTPKGASWRRHIIEYEYENYSDYFLGPSSALRSSAHNPFGTILKTTIDLNIRNHWVIIITRTVVSWQQKEILCDQDP